MKLRPLFHPALAALAVGLAGRVAAQNALSKESPFMPAGTAADAPTASETMEFAGVSVIANKTLINLYDKQAKKGRWLSIGVETDGIKVLAYDSRREQVVVKIGGDQKLLTLRKSNGPSNAPALVLAQPNPAMNFNVPSPALGPTPASETAAAPVAQPAPTQPADGNAISAAGDPAKPARPVTPPTIARQEEEARMLVSDLLEIGMAQRKAYEEKQKQAAAAEQNGQATQSPKTDG